jgi:hypothetical protein
MDIYRSFPGPRESMSFPQSHMIIWPKPRTRSASSAISAAYCSSVYSTCKSVSTQATNRNTHFLHDYQIYQETQTHTHVYITGRVFINILNSSEVKAIKLGCEHETPRGWMMLRYGLRNGFLESNKHYIDIYICVYILCIIFIYIHVGAFQPVRRLGESFHIRMLCHKVVPCSDVCWFIHPLTIECYR